MLDPVEDWVRRLEFEWGVRSPPITFEHATALRALPLLHNDPFDRILVAQAQCEDLTVITSDPAVMACKVLYINASD